MNIMAGVAHNIVIRAVSMEYPVAAVVPWGARHGPSVGGSFKKIIDEPSGEFGGVVLYRKKVTIREVRDQIGSYIT